MNAFMYYVNRIDLIRKRTELHIIDDNFRDYAINELQVNITDAQTNGFITNYQWLKLMQMCNTL